MNTKLIFIILFSGIIFSCGKEATLTFKNPQNVERSDEVFILTRKDLIDKTGQETVQYPVFKYLDNSLIPYQLDDMNDDGEWDEVAILLNFKAGEKLKVKVEWISDDSDIPDFQKRTNLCLGIKQKDSTYKEVDNYDALACDDGFEVIAQGEGVNWENDKIGFRNYFDCRNSKDLFGKRKSDMIIDKINTPELGSYHKLADWGMDILHCGSSLGAGGIAMLKNDSLFRLGSTDVYKYKKITEGPVRSVFDLIYEGWDVDGEMLSAVERISIYPGKYWFESDVKVNICPVEAQIVIGIVTSHLTKEPFEFSAGNFKCIGTHDIQSLNNDELGMAVIVPLDGTNKTGRTSDIDFFALGHKTVHEKNFSHIISETCYITQKCISGQSAKHYFFAVWGLERDQWKRQEEFIKYIKEEAEKLSEKIQIF